MVGDMTEHLDFDDSSDPCTSSIDDASGGLGSSSNGSFYNGFVVFFTVAYTSSMLSCQLDAYHKTAGLSRGA